LTYYYYFFKYKKIDYNIIYKLLIVNSKSRVFCRSFCGWGVHIVLCVAHAIETFLFFGKNIAK
jgi:hypothetical protein